MPIQVLTLHLKINHKMTANSFWGPFAENGLGIQNPPGAFPHLHYTIISTSKGAVLVLDPTLMLVINWMNMSKLKPHAFKSVITKASEFRIAGCYGRECKSLIRTKCILILLIGIITSAYLFSLLVFADQTVYATKAQQLGVKKLYI